MRSPSAGVSSSSIRPAAPAWDYGVECASSSRCRWAGWFPAAGKGRRCRSLAPIRIVRPIRLPVSNTSGLGAAAIAERPRRVEDSRIRPQSGPVQAIRLHPHRRNRRHEALPVHLVPSCSAYSSPDRARRRDQFLERQLDGCARVRRPHGSRALPPTPRPDAAAPGMCGTTSFCLPSTPHRLVGRTASSIPSPCHRAAGVRVGDAIALKRCVLASWQSDTTAGSGRGPRTQGCRPERRRGALANSSANFWCSDRVFCDVC